LPAIVTSEDFWEAAYREERSKREELETAIRTLCREHNIYQEGVQLNDMLKEMMHIHLNGNTNRLRKSSEDDLLEESTTEDGYGNNSSSGADNGHESFPSPPPSPIHDMDYRDDDEEEEKHDRLVPNGSPPAQLQPLRTPDMPDNDNGAYEDVDLEGDSLSPTANAATPNGSNSPAKKTDSPAPTTTLTSESEFFL
jgi:hypothetical protein